MAAIKEVFSFSKQKRQTGTGDAIEDSSFAIVDGSYVIGTSVDTTETDSDSIQWQRQLNNDITRLVSTNDGSVIAASTVDETMFLMRRKDGNVLVSRSIKPKPSEGEGYSVSTLLVHGISFVQNTTKSIVKDVLVVPYLMKKQDSHDLKYSMNVLVVCGIDGHAFNADCKDTKKNALMQMSSNTIRIEIPNKINQVTYFTSSFVRKNTIRFVVADSSGNVSLFDYEVSAASDVVLKDCLSLSISDDCILPRGEDEKWSLDASLGIQIDCRDNGILAILMAKSSFGRRSICWFDFETLQMVCHYKMKDVSIENNQNIICFKAINSPTNSVAIAIAIRSKNATDTLEILVVQGARVNTTNHLVHPQIVYQIPIPVQDMFAEVESTQLIGSINAKVEIYSFTFRVESGQCIKRWTFEAGEQKTIGHIKNLLATGMLDEASTMIAQLPYDQICGHYGSVHISDVALWDFKHMLTNETLLSKDNKDHLRDVFRRLATGAVSGGEHGKMSLIKASEALRKWSSSNTTQNCGPQIRDFRMVLSAMLVNVTNSMKLLHHCEFIKKELSLLEAKINCLKCIETILDIGKEGVVLGPRLGQVDDITQLYSLIIRHGAFKVSEHVRKYGTGRDIGAKQIASSVVSIPDTVNPHIYCNWLKDVAIPNLVFCNENLDKFKTWCQNTADCFDEENRFGLDASILLLSTVNNAISDVSVDKHLLFTSHFSTGRQKHELDFDSNSNCIGTKLSHAYLLKKARRLGLPRNEVKLNSFIEMGGAAYISKELIRRLCESNGVKGFSVSTIKKEVENFCQDAGVCFDTAVFEYAKSCDSSARSITLLEYSGLAHLCTNPELKCCVALKVLRAAQLSNEKAADFISFSSEAISWAQQETTKSELQATLNLTLIDDILRRYIGRKAPELFRVSNPIHSSRLLAHITRFIDVSSQLRDVLFLCDSFTHLSRIDACLRIVERITLAPETTLLPTEQRSWTSRTEQCTHIFLSLLKLDIKMTINLALRLCKFCSEVITKLCKQSLDERHTFEEENKRQYLACCSVIATVETAISQQIINSSDVAELMDRLKSYSRDFTLLQKLLEDFGVALSLSDLGDVKNIHDAKNIIQSSLESFMQLSEKSDSALKLALERAKRGISMLCRDHLKIVGNVWCKALVSVTTSIFQGRDEELGLKIIEVSGILNETGNDFAYHAIVSSIMTLCSKRSRKSALVCLDLSLISMQRVLMSGSLLQEHLLSICSDRLLPSVVFFNNAVDVMSQLILRADCGVGELMDTFKCQLRERSQSHKQLSLLREKFELESDSSKKHKKIDKLHPSWYIGDGLLLPPSEAIDYCMKLFEELLIHSSLLKAEINHSCMHGLYEFLHSRGAYSISSRVLLLTCNVIFTSSMDKPTNLFSSWSLTQIDHQINYRLSERSLGSAGSGNTSGKIDSELAVYHLLSLPVSVGFKVYQRCLPSAISGRDFARIVTLANVGLRAAGAQSIFEATFPPCSYAWKKQSKFLSQCRSLFTKAYFWKILSHFNVSFDTKCFEDTHEEIDTKYKPRFETKRALEGVLSMLISHSSRIIKRYDYITELAVDFAQKFSLDRFAAVKIQIEFMLNWSSEGRHSGRNTLDNFNSYSIEFVDYIKNLLGLLPSYAERSSVLKKSLIAFENTDDSGKDFEHYSLILSLYQTALRDLLGEKSPDSKFLIIDEIQKIDCRLDGLAIISSFFEGKPYDHRPNFQKCFPPLGEAQVTFCGVLGNRVVGDASPEQYLFDPLLPLSDSLKDEKSISALTPLCTSLGLPSGFIHARSLVERLESAKQSNGTYPSMQSHVLPTIKRLKKSRDAVQLAEWCANQYNIDDTERLTCLELAHNLAIRSSNEAEILRRQHVGDSDDMFALQERDALDTLKRITDSKSLMEDEAIVRDSLKECFRDNAGSCAVNHILTEILQKVKLAQFNEPSPEKLVENLLIQGSYIAAEASLNKKVGISDDIFSILSHSVHVACKSLEERYSHIDVSLVSRNLLRLWLLHGDNQLASIRAPSTCLSSMNKRDSRTNYEDSVCAEEEETKELCLDLHALTSSECPLDMDKKSNDKRDFTADEEPSSLKASSDGREESEMSSSRVALRIAFILLGGCSDSDIENHAKYLLRIVFAKSTLVLDRALKSLSVNNIPNDPKEMNKDVTTIDTHENALTFVMRYRALRALSAMCDRETIQKVIAEQNFITTPKCSFKKCCFGSLLAKEIESMRLSLPHSDLEQLSIMHHPSYARTLWKYFHHTDCHGYKGRYLLLLLELTLREEDEKMIDNSLVKTILNEIMKNELPRTMLLACECLAAVNDLEFIFASDEEIGAVVLTMSKKLASSILNEINEPKGSIDIEQVISTIHRLGKAIQTVLQNGLNSDEIILFVKMLCSIGENNKNDDLITAIYDITISISFKLNKTKMAEAFSIIRSTKSGHDAVCARFGQVDWFAEPSTSQFDCFDKILAWERQSCVEIASIALKPKDIDV